MHNRTAEQPNTEEASLLIKENLVETSRRTKFKLLRGVSVGLKIFFTQSVKTGQNVIMIISAALTELKKKHFMGYETIV